MRLFRNKNIEVNDSETHGRGVFTKVDLPVGTILEECHIVKLNCTWYDLDDVSKNYYFAWPIGKNANSIVMVLGYGMLYNHNKDHNVTFFSNEEKNVMVYQTVRDIKAGEELFINYGSEYERLNNLSST